MLNDFEGREWAQRGPSVEDVAKNLKEFFKKWESDVLIPPKIKNLNHEFTLLNPEKSKISQGSR